VSDLRQREAVFLCVEDEVATAAQTVEVLALDRSCQQFIVVAAREDCRAALPHALGRGWKPCEAMNSRARTTFRRAISLYSPTRITPPGRSTEHSIRQPASGSRDDAAHRSIR